MGIINDFLVKVGFEADTKKVDDFNKAIQSSVKTAGALGVALASVSGALVAFTSKSLNALDDMRQLANRTGESTLYLQQLGQVASVTGSSVESAHSSLSGLSRAIGEAATGFGRGATAFKQYGLSALDSEGKVKKASVLLEELRQKMAGLSHQEKIAMTEKLGIDSSMVQVLSMSNAQMQEALQNAKDLTLSTASEQNTKTAQAFKDSLSEAGTMIKAVSQYIALELAPSIQAFIGLIKAWFISNQKLIKESLSELAKVLGAVIRFTGALLGAINRVITATIGWKGAVLALTAVWLALNRAVLKTIVSNPIFMLVSAIVAGITLVIALVDDLLTEMNGGASLLGKTWHPFIRVLRLIGKGVQALVPIFEVLGQIGKATLATMLAGLANMFYGVLEVIAGVWELIVGIFTGDEKKIQNGFKKIFLGVFKAIKSIFHAIKSVFVQAVKATGVIFSGVLSLIKKPFLWAFEAIKAGWHHLMERFRKNPMGTIFETFLGLILKPFKMAFELIKGAWNALASIFGLPTISTIFDEMGESIKRAFKNAFSWVLEKWNALKNGLGKVLSYIGIEVGEDEKIDFDELNTKIQQAQQAISMPSSAIQHSQHADNRTINSGNKVQANITIHANDTLAGAEKASNLIGNMMMNNYTRQVA